MTLEIRPVRTKDHDEAGKVTAEAYRALGGGEPTEYLRRVADVRTRAQHARVLAAFRDGRIEGTVTVELTDRTPGGHPRPPLRKDQAHVRMLGVHPDAQRRGTGRRLMEAAIEEARRAGKRRMTLETTEAMRGAQRLYESLGFIRGPDMVFDDGFRLRSYERAL